MTSTARQTSYKPRPARALPFTFDPVPDEVRPDPRLDNRDRLVLGFLLRQRLPGLGYAHGHACTKETLSETYAGQRGWSERSIQRSFSKLRRLGYADHVPDPSDITGYRIVFPFLEPKMRVFPPAADRGVSPRETPLSPTGSQTCLPPPPLNAPARGIETQAQDTTIDSREAPPRSEAPPNTSSSFHGTREREEARPAVIPFREVKPEDLDQVLLKALVARVAAMLGAKEPGQQESIQCQLEAKARCRQGKDPSEVLIWIERLVAQAERSSKPIDDFFAWLFKAIQKCDPNGPAILLARAAPAPTMQNHNPPAQKEPIRKLPSQMSAAEREERRAELRPALDEAKQVHREFPNKHSERNVARIEDELAELKALDAAADPGGHDS